MAQDVYVIPLWRFKAGLFTTPIEELTGMKSFIVSGSAPAAPPPPPWPMRLLAMVGLIEIYVDQPPEENPAALYDRAVKEVEALKDVLTRLTCQTIDWRDDGPVRYGEQFHASVFLRAFAAWLDHRDALPEFLSERDGDHYPVWGLPAPERRRCPHLARHSLHTGYFIPVAFEGVYQVEPFKAFGHWDMQHDVASSVAVRRELEDLLSVVEELKPAGGSAGHVKNLAAAKEWGSVLLKICSLSLEHGVPVVFWG